MSNPKLEPKMKDLMELRRMREELDAEITSIEDEIKQAMVNAKAKGIKVGRKPTTKEDIPSVFYKHYPAYVAKKMNVSELARVCKLSRPTVYKYLALIVS